MRFLSTATLLSSALAASADDAPAKAAMIVSPEVAANEREDMDFLGKVRGF